MSKSFFVTETSVWIGQVLNGVAWGSEVLVADAFLFA
jgi:hypothetical protein